MERELEKLWAKRKICKVMTAGFFDCYLNPGNGRVLFFDVRDCPCGMDNLNVYIGDSDELVIEFLNMDEAIAYLMTEPEPMPEHSAAWYLAGGVNPDNVIIHEGR